MVPREDCDVAATNNKARNFNWKTVLALDVVTTECKDFVTMACTQTMTFGDAVTHAAPASPFTVTENVAPACCHRCCTNSNHGTCATAMQEIVNMYVALARVIQHISPSPTRALVQQGSCERSALAAEHASTALHLRRWAGLTLFCKMKGEA